MSDTPDLIARLRRIHRVVGLCFLLFWTLQASTGAIMVFRWELDDAAVSGESAPIDIVALETRIENLQASGAKVSSMWASGGKPDRFDIFFSTDQGGRTIRVNGVGRVLRVESGNDLGGSACMKRSSAFTSRS